MFIVVLIGLLVVALAYSAQNPRWRASPKGESWSLPFLGCFVTFITGRQQFLVSGFAKFGLIFKARFLGKNAVFSADPKLNQLLFQNENKLVVGWWPDPVKILFPGAFLNLVGREHAHPKKAIMAAFSEKQMHLFLPTIERNIREMFKSYEGVPFEAFSQLTEMAMKNVCETLFGFSSSQHAAFMLHWKAFALAFLALPFDLPGSTFRAGLRARDRLEAMLEPLLTECRSMSLEELEARKDVISILIRTQKQSGDDVTDRQTIMNCLLMLFAGTDTMVSTLSWALCHTCKYPEQQERLHEEQMQLRPDATESLTTSLVKQMVYAGAFLKENNRHRPPVEGNWRLAISDIVHEEIVIPKGTIVFWTTARPDTPGYENSYDFAPDRFLAPRSEDVKNPGTFMMWGAGPRVCAGFLYATLQITSFLALLAREYHVECIDPSQLQCESGYKATVQLPSKGLTVRWTKRV
eukprot:TRINITY_DN5032_c0_g1_i1.p1 TRINITY_DN5032_c0_g1~~TRINITY_DN5032_c0_g1_i1.p1  ORF type:complete len:465 (+),score=56.31 TRINITY_DN5032_c0_g1_i1:68-1462(+)